MEVEMKYTVKSGGWIAKIEASSAQQAVVTALKRDKPEYLGAMIEIKAKCLPGSYMETNCALELAGLEGVWR